MTQPLNRRHFVGLSLTAAVATSASAQTGLVGMLLADDAEARVAKILHEHLQIGPGDRHVVKAFVQSLKHSAEHTESPAAFAELLHDHAEAEAFSLYVVQEFVVSTNYLALDDGAALSMLTT